MSGSDHNRLFLEWMQAHRGILRKIARAFASEEGDQQDLYQDLLVAVWEAVPAFRGEAKVSTFLYRVAYNRALLWSRSRRTEQRRFEALSIDLVAPAQQDDGRVERLYEAIRQLPPVDRSLVLLYLDELSYREIAEVLGLSESNVGVRLNRAKKRLIAELS